MTLGLRIWRGFVAMGIILVILPLIVFLVGLLSVCFAPILFEMVVGMFQIYSFVPSALLLSYPDMSPKFGIPQTLYGISVVFLYWSVIALFVGTLLGVFQVPIGRARNHNRQDGKHSPRSKSAGIVQGAGG